ERIISTFMRPVTSNDRVEYFVVDDTPFPKTGKKTELVSKFFNHVNMKHQLGYRILTLIWTDGYSSIPVDFCPLSSRKADLVVCEARKYDKRSIAGRIRKDAQQKAPDVMLELLGKALRAGHSAKYVLFDSWFAAPKGITAIWFCLLIFLAGFTAFDDRIRKPPVRYDTARRRGCSLRRTASPPG
ncbi:MAG: transposase, partial [Oscillospiraceae bacterium]|nr:transposase [Oscillospiraceae bacterium]